MDSETEKIRESTLRRLAYIKGLFRLAISQFNQTSEPNMALAALIFDNCIEMMLWLLVDKYRIKINGDPYLSQLLSKLTNDKEINIKILLENASDIREMHQTRNSIQHYGIVPTMSKRVLSR